MLSARGQGLLEPQQWETKAAQLLLLALQAPLVDKADLLLAAREMEIQEILD
jgi:hypothetical protein